MSDSTDDPFEAALAGLLGPISRAVVMRGVTLGAVTEALKQALLEAVIEMEGDEVSDSRVSLLTGLHRKDVRRLRGSQAPVRRPTVNAAAMAISHWVSLRDYAGGDGQPRDLPRHGDSDGPGFDDLVRGTRADLSPGTILQALLDQGAVVALDDGRYSLRARAYLPTPGSHEMVAAYQATLTTHLKAATDNLVAPEGSARHFDRVLRYSRLSEASVGELDQLAHARAQTMLEEVDAIAQRLQDADGLTKPGGCFALGAYVLPTLPAKEGGDA
ncbi:MAG: hypothetical protein KDE08_11625 [Rhodobacteraceae bacterium]|nr:hypothetical protein [Paracoccaceae bacterium]